MRYDSKSIKTVFNEHESEIFQYMNSRSQFKQLHEKIMELLDSEELKNNPDVGKAKAIFEKLYNTNQYNTYITTFVTYQTAIKAN